MLNTQQKDLAEKIVKTVIDTVKALQFADDEDSRRTVREAVALVRCGRQVKHFGEVSVCIANTLLFALDADEETRDTDETHALAKLLAEDSLAEAF